MSSGQFQKEWNSSKNGMYKGLRISLSQERRKSQLVGMASKLPDFICIRQSNEVSSKRRFLLKEK